MAQISWNSSRYENARSCHSISSCWSYQLHNSKKLESSPLKPIPPQSSAQQPTAGYPEIGVDISRLLIQYPPTQVSMKLLDSIVPGSPDCLCELCSTIDFKDLFRWGCLDLETDFGAIQELVFRQYCHFCRLLSILFQDGLDYLIRNNERKNPYPNNYLESDFTFGEPIRASLVRDPLHCQPTKPFLVLKQGHKTEQLGPIVSLRAVKCKIREF